MLKNPLNVLFVKLSRTHISLTSSWHRCCSWLSFPLIRLNVDTQTQKHAAQPFCVTFLTHNILLFIRNIKRGRRSSGNIKEYDKDEMKMRFLLSCEKLISLNNQMNEKERNKNLFRINFWTIEWNIKSLEDMGL
jgi:hypothetical protein